MIRWRSQSNGPAVRGEPSKHFWNHIGLGPGFRCLPQRMYLLLIIDVRVVTAELGSITTLTRPLRALRRNALCQVMEKCGRNRSAWRD